MANDRDKATWWARFIGSRSYIPKATLLLKHFEAGEITRLCGCGCNSFDLEVPDSSGLEPILPAGETGGCAIELAYFAGEGGKHAKTVEINVYVDEKGFFAGLDVDYCGNSAPMPDSPTLVEPPFHLHENVGLMASNSPSERTRND